MNLQNHCHCQCSSTNTDSWCFLLTLLIRFVWLSERATIPYHLRSGLNITKHVHVTFVAEPAVDEGEPLKEYFRYVLKALSTTNSLFCDPDCSHKQNHNVIEVGKTFHHVAVLVVLSLFTVVQLPTFAHLRLLTTPYMGSGMSDQP